MAFEKVEKGPKVPGRYWTPEELNEEIEGNIFDFVKDDYGNLRIDMYLGEDMNEEPIMSMLPAHADLKRHYVNLERGDYILVKVVKVIPPRKEDGHPRMEYEIMRDPSRKVEWPEDEGDGSDYEVEEVVDDDYYE